MHRWMDEWMVGCRHEEINPQNGHIERYNWRLFKRMPIRGWIRTPSDTISISLPTKDKTLNLHSTVFRHASLHPLLRILSPFPARAYFHVRSATTASSLYLSSSVAGKLCPFAFPKAARNSRSQFSISADFSIRLRGAASRRAYAGFFTARVSHHHHPFKKKKRKKREKKGGGEKKNTSEKRRCLCPFSCTEHTAHRERRRGLKSKNPLPACWADPLQTEIQLSLGGISLLQPTSATLLKERDISNRNAFSFVEMSPRINKTPRFFMFSVEWRKEDLRMRVNILLQRFKEDWVIDKCTVIGSWSELAKLSSTYILWYFSMVYPLSLIFQTNSIPNYNYIFCNYFLRTIIPRLVKQKYIFPIRI